jgi:hypothetical protein
LKTYQTLRPPSAEITAPVKYEEASEHKNATNAWYSCGLAILPKGMRLVISVKNSCD